MSIRNLSRFAVACLATSVAFAQTPVNDEPAGAIVVGLGVNPGGPGNHFDNFFATNTTAPAAPSCGSGHNSDVWFLFTPSNTGSHVVSLCNPAGFAPGSLTDTILSVYDSTATTQLGCDDDGCAVTTPAGSSFLSQVVVSLTAGTPVYFRAASWSGAAQGTFYVTVFDNSVNGGTNCATALPITDGAWYGNLNGDVPSGFTGGGTCTNFTATTPDLYYAYTPAVSGTCQVWYDGLGTGRVAVYDNSAATCGLETLVATTCSTARNITFPVTAGVPYLVRIGLSAAATTDAAGTQIVSIFTEPNAVPVNNDCATAQTLVAGTNPMTTIGATPDAAVATCASGFTVATNNDVWGVYTTGAPAKLTFGMAGVGTQQIAVYTGVCGALVPVACGSPVSVTDSVGGTTYYVRAGTVTAANRSAANMWVRDIPIPANDECVGALPLVTGMNAGLNNFGSSTSAGVPSCQAANNDVWYTWTAPITATITISACGSSSDPAIAVYDVCGGTQLACDDDDLNNLGPCATTQTLNPYLELPVTAGTTYLIRVFNNTAADMSFNLNLVYKFSLAMTYDNVNFTFTVADVAGNPGDLALNAITINAGAFPNGYFYGVDIPIFEVFTLILSGPPFFVLLDGSGAFSQTLTGVPPLGITVYGVGVDFTPAGIFAKKSVPVSTILL